MKRKIIVLLFLICIAVLLSVIPVYAFGASDLGVDYAGNVGLGTEDPRTMIQLIVNLILTFLAIIAVIVILMGGFKWMTAGGNEDNVAQAKKLLTAGIIGLAIVLAAWGIALFVINQMLNISGA